jgi:hypothetical protein
VRRYIEWDLPEEVPKDRLEHIPANKDPEIVRGNVLQTNRSGELADETDATDHEARQSQALGASSCFQGFSRDDTLEWGISERKNDVEKIVECKSSLALGLANVTRVCNLL